MLICHLEIFGAMSVKVIDSFFSQVIYFLTIEFQEFFVSLDNSLLLDISLQIFYPCLWLVFSFFLHCLSQSRNYKF